MYWHGMITCTGAGLSEPRIQKQFTSLPPYILDIVYYGGMNLNLPYRRIPPRVIPHDFAIAESNLRIIQAMLRDTCPRDTFRASFLSQTYTPYRYCTQVRNN